MCDQNNKMILGPAEDRQSKATRSGSIFMRRVVSVALAILSLVICSHALAAKTSEETAKNSFLEGKKAFDAGNSSGADHLWKPILSDNLYGPVAYLLLARSFARDGAFSKSENLVKEFLKLYPASPYREASIEDLTDYVYQQGKPEASKLMLNAFPNASEARKQTLLLRMGDIEVRHGAYSKAETYYRKLYINYPAGQEGLQAKERISRMVFNGKIPKPEFTEAELLARASRLTSAGRHDMAADVYHSLSTQKPTDYSLTLRYARALYKDRKNELAIKTLQEVIGKPIPEEKKLEALYTLSLVYWRTDQDSEFVASCARILEKGTPALKKRVLANLAAFNYEKGGLAKAEAYYKRLLAESPEPSVKAKIKWRLAWIKYRSRNYAGAANDFREVRQISNDGHMGKASKYWEARSTTLAGNFDRAAPLFKSLAEESPYDYYGSQAQKILVSAKQPVVRNGASGKTSFPDLSLSAVARSNILVSHSIKLMGLGLPEFALMNLQALPKGLRSSQSITYMMAKAAQESGYYGLAHEIIVSGFYGLVDNPPGNAPKEFLEMIFPRPHQFETAQNASKGGVDPLLVWSIVRQESAYDSCAVSPAGALGLMQVTPRTALVVSNQSDCSSHQIVQDLLDARKNLALGILILAQNVKQFKGNIIPAIAAYNADINKVKQWVGRNGRMRQDEFIENIPYSETRLYVKKVLANLAAYSKIYSRQDLAGHR
jgi:peptidoglycan lytic transglycosylase